VWKLLLVDDEEIIREGLRDGVPWAQASIRVVGEAEDGAEALRKVRSLSPDIVLADIVMPGLTGLDFVKELRKEGQRCKVVFLSAHQKTDFMQTAFKVEAVDYLLKPVDIDELIAVMRRIAGDLEREQQQRQRLIDLEALLERRRTQDAAAEGSEPTDSPRIRRIKETIHGCFDRDVSLDDISELVGLSTAHMESVFKAETGRTVHECLSAFRMERAMALLSDPTYRIYEVANAVGYRDPNYFCRAFKKHVGVSPGDFRNGL
jgi:two-component system response regulator YesN